MTKQLKVPDDFDRMGEPEIGRLFGSKSVNFLLDTHVLLWAAGQPEKLSRKTRGLLSDPDNSLLFSAVSLWEIVIKQTIGRDDFKVDPTSETRTAR